MLPVVKKLDVLFAISPKAETKMGCVGQAIVGGMVSKQVVTLIGHVWLVHKPVWSQIVKQIES